MYVLHLQFHITMVTSSGFQATAVWPPFVSGLQTGEGVVFIHKLSGHMKCLVTHVKDLDRYSTTHRTKNISYNIFWLFSVIVTNHIFTKIEAFTTGHTHKRLVFVLFLWGGPRAAAQKYQWLDAFIHIYPCVLRGFSVIRHLPLET